MEERECSKGKKDEKESLSDILPSSTVVDILSDEIFKDQVERIPENANSVFFKNARWKVLFSDNFRKSFQMLKCSEMRKLVINFLLRLSGGWRPRKRSAVTYCNHSSQVLRQYRVKDLYVVVSIDIVKESRYTQSYYTQVLKIWDILPSEDIPDLIERLNVVFASYTDEYINRCKQKGFEGDLEVPRNWPSSVAQYKNSGNAEIESSSRRCSSEKAEAVENCQVKESLLLMKFYSLSSNLVRHMLSGCDGKEVEFPFELTDQEKEIMYSRGTSFVLGRSGTGKTTVIIMKLFQREQLHHVASQGFHDFESGEAESYGTSQMNEYLESGREKNGDILRQIFVTVNARLSYAVRQHICRLKRSTCGWNDYVESTELDEHSMDETSQFSEIPDSFVELPLQRYPLVITFNKFLMMLDGTIGMSFFEKFPEVRALSRGNKKTAKSSTLQTFIRTKEVTYGRFCSSYWLHLDKQLTKSLDPSIVFKEIISYIKGGWQDGVALDGVLSREDYVMLSEKRGSTLSKLERGRIYDLFVKYEKLKKKFGEFDLADFVMDLHHRFMHAEYEGDAMDFVYVDEVQDLTMRQISLFKYICKNLGEGFVFAGDTAQTIARGVDFRFQDLRSFFYREFIHRQNGFQAHGLKNKGLLADTFNLTHNFRTHVGILNLAQSVINLLYHFFPFSIDKLSPETSPIHGDAPILVQTSKDQGVLTSLFEGYGTIDHHIVGFGAEQAILVRDEGVKNQILKQVGNKALVLTIMECKGLEFQDVLLFDFFSPSPRGDIWSVIYGYMKEQNILGSASFQHFKSFDEGKHMILCSELKQLYVAITRTRQRFWISESLGLPAPILDYWTMLHLVRVRHLDQVFVQEMQVPSSKESWKSRGMKFFYEQKYDMARICFEKSGATFWVSWAEAAGLRSAADCSRLSLADCAKLTKAAQIYESIGKFEYAAQCFLELKDYGKAGMIYVKYFGETKLEEAGDCFHLAKCYDQAGQIYDRCGAFSKCLSVCADGQLFEKGWQYIQLWKENSCSNASELSTGIDRIRHGDSKTEEMHNFLERGALHFHKLKDQDSTMKFLESFQSRNLLRNFLVKMDFRDELLLFEIKWGNVSEAAAIAKEKGNVRLEADLRERAGQFEEACMIILSHVFASSLWKDRGKGWPLKNFDEKEVLLMKAKTLAKNVSSQFFDSLCIELQALSDKRDTMQNLNQCFQDSQRYYSVRGGIISSRKIIDAHLCSTTSNDKVDKLVGDLISYKENRISWDHVSVENLMCCWSFWRGEIEKVCENLRWGLEEEDAYTDFCLNYFGVKKLLKGKKTNYVIIYPDMEWTQHFDFKFRDGDLGSVNSRVFIHSAQSHWSSEILSVGMLLLEKLEALYWFSVNNAVPICGQSMLLVHMSNVSKFIIDSEMLDHSKSRDTLIRLLKLSTESFFANIFTIDWRKSLTEDMIHLREMNICRNTFNKLASLSRLWNTYLTHGEIGKLIAIMLSGNLPCHLYKQIALRLDNRALCPVSMRSFRGNRRQDIAMNYSPTNFSRAPSDGFLVQRLYGVLTDYYFSDVERTDDYMLPSSFLYIVDRLLILVSYVKGYFYTVKSSLLEWLICQKWNANPHFDLWSDMQPSVEGVFDLVACIVADILCNEQKTQRWIMNSNMDSNCYPHFVLRLVVILCLLCINTGRYFDLLFSFLSRREITSLLPWEFFGLLRSIRRCNTVDQNIQAIGEALANIGNPVVTVALGGDSPKFSSSSILFLDLTIHRGRKTILKQLYSKNNLGPATRWRSKLRSRYSFNISYTGKLATSRLAFEVDQLVSTQNEDGLSKQRKDNRHFWLMLEFMVPQKGVVGLTYFCDALWFKGKVLEHTFLVNAAIRHCYESASSGNLRDLIVETSNLLDELQQLYSALDLSDDGIEYPKKIDWMMMKLMSRRPRMEPFLDQLLEKSS